MEKVTLCIWKGYDVDGNDTIKLRRLRQRYDIYEKVIGNSERLRQCYDEWKCYNMRYTIYLESQMALDLPEVLIKGYVI